MHTEGELAPGAFLLEHVLNTLPVEAEATHIPESVTVSIEGLEAGASILAKDIPLPEGTTLAVDEDAVVLQVLAAQAEEPAEGEGEGEASRRGLILRGCLLADRSVTLVLAAVSRPACGVPRCVPAAVPSGSGGLVRVCKETWT